MQDELSEEEMVELAAALEEADDLAHKVEYLESAKMPCPECGGSGQMVAGSLGGVSCLNCNGARFVDHPSMHGQGPYPAVAQIRGMRQRFLTYTRLLDYDPRVSDGPAPTQRQLAEAASKLPSVTEVQKASITIAKASMALPGAQAPRPGRLLEGERESPQRHDDDWGDVKREMGIDEDDGY